MPWISKRDLDGLRKTIERYEQNIRDLRSDKHAVEDALRGRINDLEDELKWFKENYKSLMDQSHDAISLLHKVGPWNTGGNDLYALSAPEHETDKIITDEEREALLGKLSEGNNDEQTE